MQMQPSMALLALPLPKAAMGKQVARACLGLPVFVGLLALSRKNQLPPSVPLVNSLLVLCSMSAR